MFGMFYTSYLSGISSAIIIAIYAATVLTTALAFYFAHEETPSFKHFVGMICIIISIILIAYSKDSPLESSAVAIISDVSSVPTIASPKISTIFGEIEVGSLSTIYPISFAFFGCCIFTGTSLISREIYKCKMN